MQIRNQLHKFTLLYRKHKSILLIGACIVIVTLCMILWFSIDHSKSIPTKDGFYDAKPHMVAPSAQGSAYMIRVYRSDNLSMKRIPVFKMNLGDIFRLEIPENEAGKSYRIPKFGIEKIVSGTGAGVLEFQANQAGVFDMFCSDDKNICGKIEINE